MFLCIFRQSKKKVVGMCKACNKPVTAGARQMHLFFHMAKDLRVSYLFSFFEKHEPFLGIPILL